MINKIIWSIVAVAAIICTESLNEDMVQVVGGLCGWGLLLMWAIDFFEIWGKHLGGIIRMTYITNPTPRIAFVLASRILIIVGVVITICIAFL